MVTSIDLTRILTGMGFIGSRRFCRSDNLTQDLARAATYYGSVSVKGPGLDRVARS